MAVDVQTAHPKVHRLVALVSQQMLKYASSVDHSIEHGRVTWRRENNGRMKIRLELNIEDDD